MKSDWQTKFLKAFQKLPLEGREALIRSLQDLSAHLQSFDEMLGFVGTARKKRKKGQIAKERWMAKK